MSSKREPMGKFFRVCSLDVPLSAISKEIFDFLKANNITSRTDTDKIGSGLGGESETETGYNNWYCYTVTDSAQLLKFTIHVFPHIEGTCVEFVRENGTQYRDLAILFGKYEIHSGIPLTSFTLPNNMPLPFNDISDDSENPLSVDEYKHAIGALLNWIDADPEQALQSIGIMSWEKSSFHLLESSTVLEKLVEILCLFVSDFKEISLSLGLACLRVFIKSSVESGITHEFSDIIIGKIKSACSGALDIASRNNNLTVEKEAKSLVDTINSLGVLGLSI